MVATWSSRITCNIGMDNVVVREERTISVANREQNFTRIFIDNGFEIGRDISTYNEIFRNQRIVGKEGMNPLNLFRRSVVDMCRRFMGWESIEDKRSRIDIVTVKYEYVGDQLSALKIKLLDVLEKIE